MIKFEAKKRLWSSNRNFYRSVWNFHKTRSIYIDKDGYPGCVLQLERHLINFRNWKSLCFSILMTRNRYVTYFTYRRQQSMSQLTLLIICLDFHPRSENFYSSSFYDTEFSIAYNLDQGNISVVLFQRQLSPTVA